MPQSVEDAFQHSLLALLPRLRRFAYGLTGALDDGDELVQSACLKALENRRRYRAGTRLDSWLYKIMQNLWIDQQRRRRRREIPTDGRTVPDRADPLAERAAEGRIMLSAADRAIMALPAEQRSVLLLVTVDGLAYREAAEILSVPLGTVMSRLARARLALAERLDLGPEVTRPDTANHSSAWQEQRHEREDH